MDIFSLPLGGARFCLRLIPAFVRSNVAAAGGLMLGVHMWGLLIRGMAGSVDSVQYSQHKKKTAEKQM